MYQEYKRILVPIDGSDEAEKAFQKAVQAALRNEGILDIAHVIDTRTMQTGDKYDTRYTTELVEQAKQLLADYEAFAKEHGVKEVYTHLEFGLPKQTIAHDLSERCGCELIMMGATGLSTLERIVMGSVSAYVIRNAPCDVLIVRTDLENQ